jgi:hypothetical protein
LWAGQKDSKGHYGKVSYMNEKYIAHSFIFKLHNNTFGSKYTNHLHTCDTPLCCNWHHIYCGTHQDNMDDKVSRNRQLKGAEQKQAILNDSKVRQIRRNYYTGWLTHELAYFFDVSPGIITRIIKHHDWSHLQGELLIK